MDWYAGHTRHEVAFTGGLVNLARFAYALVSTNSKLFSSQISEVRLSPRTMVLCQVWVPSDRLNEFERILRIKLKEV